MSAPPRDIKADVSCVDCLNGLFFCFGPFHQFDRYYKDGHLVRLADVADASGEIIGDAHPASLHPPQDDCSAKFRDLRLCTKLKFADSEGTKALVRELIAVRKSPTEGVVWQRRPSPPQNSAASTSAGGAASG